LLDRMALSLKKEGGLRKSLARTLAAAFRCHPSRWDQGSGRRTPGEGDSPAEAQGPGPVCTPSLDGVPSRYQ